MLYVSSDAGQVLLCHFNLSNDNHMPSLPAYTIRNMDTSIEPTMIVRQVMRDYNWTQEEFAARARVSFGTVNRWLNGRTALSERRLLSALANAKVDPTRYGAGNAPALMALDDDQPEWAVRMESKIDEILKYHHKGR